MITSLMALALKERVVVIGLALLLLLAGVWSFAQLDVEAYPDPVQPMVEVLTLPSGYSAEEVEKLVTVPTEFGLAGMRDLQRMDSISLFGLSDVRCYFDWESDYYWDRVETINRLGMITMPNGISPGISPENPIGEIYRYTVEGPDHDLLKEKEIEDWVLEKHLKTVDGVLDVSGFGGLSKEYHVDVDPQKLAYYNIPLSTLISSISNANNNAGGNYLSVGEQAFNVRGIGFMHSLDDIRNVVLQTNNGTPIRVANVADVDIGYSPRLGTVGMNNQDEVVTGIVLMRKYGDTLKTLKGVEAKVRDLNHSGILPTGYKIVPYYDRTTLVDTTLQTVLENLTIGMALVFLVLMFFLANLRAALIAAINIPLALCGAFMLMHLRGTPANLISLGAIDFGIIIDTTVIVMENIHRALTVEDSHAPIHLKILHAAQEVGGPMFFSTIIFVIAFLPLFTMRGVEGAIFSPMSQTYAFALGTAILLAVTLSPVLGTYFFAGGMYELPNPIWKAISAFYHRVFTMVLRIPRITVAAIVLLLVAVFSLFPLLGGQFLPKLEEGNIWAHATLPMNVSFEQAAKTGNRVRHIFMSFPEVSTVVSQTGRPDDGTETTGFFNIEFSVELKPDRKWPKGLTKDELVKDIDAKLQRQFPGIGFYYSQNIEDNVNEALSGVKGSNSVKVFGPDLAVDERIANEVNGTMSRVPGIVDTAVYRSLGQPNLLIRPDRDACARYGLNVGDVTAVVQAAIGGQAVTQVLEGDRRFDLVVRWLPQYRQSLEAIRNIRVNIPAGGQIPLAQLAHINTAEGASLIYREDFERYVPVRFATRGRDLQTAVMDAKRTVAQNVKLPEGVHLVWAGEYGELQAANRRLMIVVPFALLLIAGVLYGATTSLVDTFVIMAQIPVACLGGILGLILTHTPFSVSAAVGFISIFGIAVMDGILLSFYIRELWEEGHPFAEAIIMGSDRRLRATMMTDLVDALGLLPAALSTRIGAQTQRPLAIVVIGGALAIMMLTRVLQPALIYLCHRRLRLADQQNPPMPPLPPDAPISPLAPIPSA
ncbi:MAG TPA: CusA/CzcA family heavy metal efflux RND transporter, partial [Candidatus Binataceae bacterium]|nr:CusA/CzcA family heavy metal efflux RND transporter [Candidatus Binataceae bacterium]